MHRQLNERLLREYVKQILEDEYSDPGAGEISGASLGTFNDLKAGLITPFTDVIQTAIGKSKEINNKAGTLLRVAFEGFVTALLPGFSADYTAIFDREKKQIEQIRSKYKDVYDRTDKSLAGSGGAMLAFMASPALVISATSGKYTAKALKGLLSVSTAGASDWLYDKAKENLIKADRWTLGGPKTSLKSSGSAEPKNMWGESQLYEQDDEEGKKKLKPKDVLTNKKLVDKAFDAPEAKQMQKTAVETYRKTLQDVHDRAETILKKVNSIEDIVKLIGNKLDAKTKESISDIKKLPPDEQKKSNQIMLQQIRKSVKEIYVKGLSKQLQEVLDAGIPEEAQYVKDYRDIIAKIKAL